MRRIYSAGLLCLSVLMLPACGGGASGAADAAAANQHTPVVQTAATTCAWDEHQLDECQWE